MNEIELELVKEGTRAAIEVVKEVSLDIIRPSSKSIGTNLGLMVDGTMGWLGCWGEKQKLKQQKHIEDFKSNIENKVNSIEIENLKEPSMSIVGPAIESSKYFYEEPYYRELFSNLVAAACDKSKVNNIHPSYVEIIKQLSPIDAKLLSMYKYHNTYPIADLYILDIHKNVTPCTHYLFDFKDKSNEFSIEEHLLLTSSLENLIRLGIVKKNQSIYELNYDYEQFKNHFLYLSFSKMKKNDNDKVELTKYRLELTSFGTSFVSICF